MRPVPDCGEIKYIGNGHLRYRKTLATGGDPVIGRATAISCALEGTGCRHQLCTRKTKKRTGHQKTDWRNGSESHFESRDLRDKQHSAIWQKQLQENLTDLISSFWFRYADRKSENQWNTGWTASGYRHYQRNSTFPDHQNCLAAGRSAYLQKDPGSIPSFPIRYGFPCKSAVVTFLSRFPNSEKIH